MLLLDSADAAAGGAGRCRGLVAYLRVAAADNAVAEKEVLSQARRLYERLSERLHAEPAPGVTCLPAAIFPGSKKAAVVALAAIARFAGRDIELYSEELGVAIAAAPRQLKLRLRALAASSDRCAITERELRSAAFCDGSLA